MKGFPLECLYFLFLYFNICLFLPKRLLDIQNALHLDTIVKGQEDRQEQQLEEERQRREAAEEIIRQAAAEDEAKKKAEEEERQRKEG